MNYTFSNHYGTKLEFTVWSSLHKQMLIHSWSHPDWRDKPEGWAPKLQSNARAADMEANPYRRHCKENGLVFGTEVKKVSNTKYRLALLFTSAMESLKHLAGMMEALIRLPISIGISVTAFTATTLRINRLCPSRVKVILNTTKDTIQSPGKNLNYCVNEMIGFIFFTIYAPCISYRHWNKYNIDGIYKDLSNQVRKM